MVSAETTALKQSLRDAGLRATTARIAVLRCLAGATGPLSHAEVCDSLADAGFDRTTLYRNLVDLTEVELARRTDLGDHVWRFELIGPNDGHSLEVHPHFVCRQCGEVECLPEGSIEVRAVRGSPKALKRSAVEVHVRGLCDACNG